jgi:hypothetical protein
VGDIDTPRYIEAHSAPLQGEDGVLAGIVSVFADVTEERGIQQAKATSFLCGARNALAADQHFGLFSDAAKARTKCHRQGIDGKATPGATPNSFRCNVQHATSDRQQGPPRRTTDGAARRHAQQGGFLASSTTKASG